MLKFYSKLNTAYFMYGKKKMPLWYFQDYVSITRAWQNDLVNDIKYKGLFERFQNA